MNDLPYYLPRKWQPGIEIHTDFYWVVLFGIVLWKKEDPYQNKDEITIFGIYIWRLKFRIILLRQYDINENWKPMEADNGEK